MFSRRSGEPSLDLSHLVACDCEPEELRALFAPFRFELDVSCEDTDLSGAVYHANYLRFFGRARASWVGPAAFAALYARANVRFVIRGVSLRFRRPARFGDRLEIVTRSLLPTPHTLEFEHVARLAGSERSVASGQVSAACVNAEDQPIPIPIAELVRIRREFGLPVRPTAAAER